MKLFRAFFTKYYGPTDGPTDRRTDTRSYRDARTHLKKWNQKYCGGKWKWQKERKPAYSENGEYKWKGGHRNDIGTEKGMNVRNIDGRLVEL